MLAHDEPRLAVRSRFQRILHIVDVVATLQRAGSRGTPGFDFEEEDDEDEMFIRMAPVGGVLKAVVPDGSAAPHTDAEGGGVVYGGVDTEAEIDAAVEAHVAGYGASGDGAAQHSASGILSSPSGFRAITAAAAPPTSAVIAASPHEGGAGAHSIELSATSASSSLGSMALSPRSTAATGGGDSRSVLTVSAPLHGRRFGPHPSDLPRAPAAAAAGLVIDSRHGSLALLPGGVPRTLSRESSRSVMPMLLGHLGDLAAVASGAAIPGASTMLDGTGAGDPSAASLDPTDPTFDGCRLEHPAVKLHPGLQFLYRMAALAAIGLCALSYATQWWRYSFFDAHDGAKQWWGGLGINYLIADYDIGAWPQQRQQRFAVTGVVRSYIRGRVCTQGASCDQYSESAAAAAKCKSCDVSCFNISRLLQRFRTHACSVSLPLTRHVQAPTATPCPPRCASPRRPSKRSLRPRSWRRSS